MNAAEEGPQDAPPAGGGSRFLSRGQVASLFGVSVSTVTRWARMGLIPAIRTPGGHYRYRADDIHRASREGSPSAIALPD